MKPYNSSDIEKKWQEYWQKNKTFKTPDSVNGKENFYALSEFAYPSGNLHVGHWYAFAVPDIYARFKRMQGYNVLYPMGFDAFGLPAENAAIKRGLDPRKWTYENMDYMRNQLLSMGASFDWDRQIATCYPDYYKWTQWMFTEFYKNNLIERKLTKTNWCESCKTVLANEQVIAGTCERCGNDVVQRDMAQWMLKITDFADELVDDLDTLNWDESIKQSQREWIGRKEGSEISFQVKEPEMYDINTGPGDDAFREGEPVVERNNVVVIIEHPEKDEFLCAKWKQVDWQGFVTGGIENGQSIEEAALEEVREETGYQNPEIVKVYNESSHGLFWHVIKKENRQANYRIVHVKLKDLEYIEPLAEEQDIADFVWVPRAEVNDFLMREDMKYPWRVVNGVNKFLGEAKKDSKERNVVRVILLNEKNKVLIMESTTDGAMDIPGGGINEGETLQEAAIRELREETEFTNFEFIKEIKPNFVNYHHLAKKQDFYGKMYTFVYRLADNEQTDKNTEEHEPDTNENWWELDDVIENFIENPVYGFSIKESLIDYRNSKIDIFTTRADTLFGVTYIVLSPEHEFIQSAKHQIQNWDEVESYLSDVQKKSDLDRQQSKEKTGVELKGITVINPATNEEIPVWVADYVLAHFGTGAVMAVPAHDERDCEFALKYDLPFKFVILPSAGEMGNSRPLVTSGENAFILSAGSIEEAGQKKINAEWNAMYDLLSEVHNDNGILPAGKRFCCTFEGKLINSPGFNTQTSEDARKNITESVNGVLKKTYRLRDWGISRQRYWGCPIPMVYDPEGNPYIVPKEHLPWELPSDVDHTPDGTAPLARSGELKKRTEEIFGKGWAPEVDTMDTFVDSSWYFYRYLDNNNHDNFASKEALKNWMPVDMYFGGAEHTTMHLLYSRFWVKALHRLGYVDENEPYKGRLNRGLILGPDGAKMSKSKGNVIDPDEVVFHVGADAVRMYLAFIGPFNEPGNYPWDPNGVVGVRRFIERVWRLAEKVSKNESHFSLQKELHKTIKKVSEDVDRLKLNTAISTMMVFINHAEKESHISKDDYEMFIKIFGVFAPHTAEELWQEILENSNSIHLTQWPKYNNALTVDDVIKIGVQVNGKIRTEIEIEPDADADSVKEKVLKIDDIKKWIDNKEIKKFIYIPEKIINIVV